MRTTILVLGLLGCVAEPLPPDTSETVSISMVDETPQRDVCGLAAALPPENICSLVCDPDALKDALLARGDAPGRCYELNCVLSDGSSVFVGVCLQKPKHDGRVETIPSAR